MTDAAYDRDNALMGVEEEYLVVDPATGDAAPHAARVLAEAALGDRASCEITRFQVEAKTTPLATGPAIAAELLRLRAAMSEAAGRAGTVLVASGLPVRGPATDPPIVDDPRYDVGIATYRSLHDEQSNCAAHVHVHLPDREEAVLAGNHLRPWLPVLLAISANSPYFAGRDTGYASWRAVCWGRWPVAGPPPFLTSYAHYEETVALLTETGALVDPGTIFWDVRPSTRLPTLEVRVADVLPTAAEAALYAVLVRGLVRTALDRVAAGDPGPPLPAELLRAAYWRAARDGLEGSLVDPATGALRPAAAVLDGLVQAIRPALERSGDVETVTSGLKRLTATGTGAARQRAAGGSAAAVTALTRGFLAD